MMDRLARLADRRARRVLAIAALFFVVAGALGAGVADRLDPYGADDPDTESVIAAERLEGAGFRETGVVVLVDGADVRSPRGGASPFLPAPMEPIDDRARHGAAERIADSLAGSPGVSVGGAALAEAQAN